MTYDKAVALAGYHHSRITTTDGTADTLPPPEDVRNPLVQQSLYELRNVVNAIIREHGKPDMIRVELARDTKLPKWRRKGILALNRRREARRDALRKRLVEEGLLAAPTLEDLIKYELWEECNHTCPYTGKKIPLSNLFSSAWQIEHIIPYSRSLDDSQANKTLCHWKENQRKHNQTPYEAFGHDKARYEEILERVRKFQPVERIVKRDHANFAIVQARNTKINKFLIKNVEKELTSEFISRQLVDTAYISRLVRNYLRHICARVEASPGRTTATLRRLWGLNTILSGHPELKQREDHRQHAVDALVVACTTPGFVQTMSRYHSYDREPGRERFPLPWRTYYQDAEQAVMNVLVSHKVNPRVRGPLHKETNYGRITLPDGNETYVVRKNLTDLSHKDVERIVDGRIKKLIIDRLVALGVDVSGKIKVPRGAFDEPLRFPGSGVPIKKVRVAVPTKEMLLLRPKQKLYVEYGKNHHVEIFENAGGERQGRFISLFEAAQRIRRGEPVIDRTPPAEGWHFVMSLMINELLLLDVEPELIDWDNPPTSADLGSQLFRVQKMSVTGIITLRHHTVSLTGESDPGVERRSPNTLRGIKVRINPLGRLSPVD
jgi:CRISPR-associated endonuclease Csn1